MVHKHKYLCLILIITLVIMSAAAGPAYAAGKDNKVVQFFKNVVKWPFGIAKRGSEAVGRTAYKATMTTTKTASSSVEAVTGKPEKLKDVIVEPVKGGAETARTAVEETVKTPIEGTKDAFK